jgi:RNA polymerase sigma-70 factor (ECF subfamily)
MEERELVRRSQEGDKSAFALLVQRYKTKVHGLAYSFTRDAVLADDLAQDIFLKAWFGLARFKGRSQFGTWIYRISVNHIKDHLRKKTASREVPLEKVANQVRAAQADPPAENGAEDKEQRIDLVRRCLAGLPEKYRVILTLRDIQGLSYEELSRALDLSAGTVDSRLFRARRLLRERVETFRKGDRREP